MGVPGPTLVTSSFSSRVSISGFLLSAFGQTTIIRRLTVEDKRRHSGVCGPWCSGTKCQSKRQKGAKDEFNPAAGHSRGCGGLWCDLLRGVQVDRERAQFPVGFPVGGDCGGGS